MKGRLLVKRLSNHDQLQTAFLRLKYMMLYIFFIMVNLLLFQTTMVIYILNQTFNLCIARKHTT